MASIAFTDATGTVTLANDKPGVGGRFRNWIPGSQIVGPKHHALADGARYAFAFRTDFVATFRLECIPRSRMEELDRLRLHLDGGGTITVTTGDADSHVYTCGLAPDAPLPEPEWDAEFREFAITLSVINRAASPSSMLCIYP